MIKSVSLSLASRKMEKTTSKVTVRHGYNSKTRYELLFVAVGATASLDKSSVLYQAYKP